MKTKYLQFINEELKHLPPPPDEETFSVSPFRRITLCNMNKLDMKFYPSDKEIEEYTKENPDEALQFYQNIGEDEKVVELIEKFGANINKLYKFYNRSSNMYYDITPLMHYILCHDFDMVKYLVEHGADVNMKGEYGDTAIFSAISNKNLDILKYLVENGADVNIQKQNGNTPTPLFYAVMFGNIQIIKYLLEHGADVNIKNEEGKTPYYLVYNVINHYNVKNHNSELKKLFKKYNDSKI